MIMRQAGFNLSGVDKLDTELVATCFHEAGHALTTVIAFREAIWLPTRAPAWPVRCIEVHREGPGVWRGLCTATSIFSAAWPIEVLRRLAVHQHQLGHQTFAVKM
jgi:hypothetical protein